MPKIELAKALLAFQKDAPPIHFDAKNPHFGNKCASLAGVVAAIRPALNKQGVIYTQQPTTLDGLPALRTTLTHAESGDELEDVMPLFLAKSDAQGYGSALTYARRYALLSVLGLVGDDDDDANHASGNTVQPKVTATFTPPPADTQGLQQSRGDTVLPGQVLVPFGKHKNKKVSDVPRDYWDWWLGEGGAKNPEVLAAVQEHLGISVDQGDDLNEQLPF